MSVNDKLKSFLDRFGDFTSKEVRSLIVVSAVGFAQGLSNSSDLAFSYIYKDDYKLSPTQSSFFDISNKLPWMIKPVWGSISDNFNLFGYKRKSYIMLMAVIGWICLLNFGVWLPPLGFGFVLLVFLNISLSFESCMAQAVLVRNAQEISRQNSSTEQDNGKAASNGVSAFFGARYVGSMLGSLIVMKMFNENESHEFIFGISFVPLGLLAISFLLPEKRSRNSIVSKDQAPKVIEMGSYVSSTTSLANTETTTQISERTPSNPSNFKRTLNFIKNPIILKSVLLMFLSSFAPQSPQAKFYYYTLYLGFDASFLGSLDFIAISAVLLAIFIYNRWLRSIDIKKFYAGTVIFACVITLSQLILVFRLNEAMGLSDRIFAALDTFVIELVLQFSSLPVLVLACRMCPKDIEATIFALLVSVSNAGGIISLQLGTLLTYLLGITSENFENLWIMITITSIFYLIPLTVLFNIHIESAFQDTEKPLYEQGTQDENESVPSGQGLERLDDDKLTSDGEKKEPEPLVIKQGLYSKLVENE